MNVAIRLAAASAAAVLVVGLMGQSSRVAAQRPGGAPATAPADRQAEAGKFPARPFLRQNLDKLTWTATEGNKLGVQTAVVDGDPSKPGY